MSPIRASGVYGSISARHSGGWAVPGLPNESFSHQTPSWPKIDSQGAYLSQAAVSEYMMDVTLLFHSAHD
jgi:hypothetical protein